MKAVSLLRKKFLLIWLVPFMLATAGTHAQSPLNKTISVNLKSKPLSVVLNMISEQGGFYFSYNSHLIAADSMVSISVNNKTVREALDQVFAGRFEYKQTGNYIILQNKEPGLSDYDITGYISDTRTGEKIRDASIYETQQLVSVFSDENGFFRLHLKKKTGSAVVHVSKVSYKDTSLVVPAEVSQDLVILINAVPYELAPVYIYGKVEKTWMAKFFLSSRQIIQSLNIRNYFADKPYQFSLTPGLGTHGRMGSQVINKFSLNIIGGYTAGVNGVEVGSVFNIVQKDVNKLQVAGMFNAVGGKLRGVQVAGLQNTVLDSVHGVQVAGLNNRIKAPVSGVQVGGLFNKVSRQVTGVQVAGLTNIVSEKMEGFQLAALVNSTRQEVQGMQMAGLLNYTKKLNGLQVGMINISDSSDGFALGLINFSKNYHLLSVYTDELGGIDLAYKSGNRKLYSFINLGYNPSYGQRLFSFGYGFGSEIRFGRKIFISPEFNWRYIYTGSWDHLSDMLKFSLNAAYRINSWLSVFAGPGYSVYFSNQNLAVAGYRYPVPSEDYHTHKFSDRISGWLGWRFGINLF